MKTYSNIVVLDWQTDDGETNSFGYNYGYQLEIKCDLGLGFLTFKFNEKTKATENRLSKRHLPG